MVVSPKASAGADIDAHCNKCNLVLAHVVIAVQAGKPVKVECKTCKGVHAFRRQAKAPSTGSARKSADKGPPGAADYDRLVAGKDLSRARRYAPSETYATGEVVDHKNFGLGVATRLISGGKLEVLFPAGAKVLVHGIA